MKTKMKMKMVVVLSCVLCVSADFLHEDLSISGCSDSDGENLITVDGEEKWYADFINGRGVMPQPSFIDPITCSTCYENAVAQLHICKTNLEKRRSDLKNPPVQLDRPSSPTMYSRDDVELGENNILICHVTGFYPAPVNISWTKNREIVTKGSSINIPFPNKDGTFTQVSRLEFIPQLGDIYSCTVRHPSLDQPLTRFWARPYVRLHSVTPPGGKHSAMLVCSVFDFYPKYIRVSWLRDGKEVTSDVSSTDEMRDGDWYYQIHSHLEYTPRSGEKIACVVEHASLREPLVTDWDPSMPETERIKTAIGTSGVILGLIVFLAGFIDYKRKARGRTLVPSN